MKLDMYQLNQLENDGFCVVPNFLNSVHIDNFIEDYNKSKKFEKDSPKNHNYQIFSSSYFIDDLINVLLKDISDNSQMKSDFITPGIYWDNEYINFSWHQDYEPYYLYQDLYNAFNFWIPVIKPNYNKSGVSIVPHSRLNSIMPNFYEKYIKGQGAKRFTPTGKDKTYMIDEETGESMTLNVNLNDLAYSPDLNPGDLLLLRQDIIHRSQDRDDHRVAISIKTHYSDTILKLEKFLTRCPRKKHTILNHPLPYSILENYFTMHNASEIKLGDYLNYLKG